jgi:hypothetical protein
MCYIPYILACHLQIDADPVSGPDPAHHFDADPDFLFDTDADSGYQNDPQHYWFFLFIITSFLPAYSAPP